MSRRILHQYSDFVARGLSPPRAGRWRPVPRASARALPGAPDPAQYQYGGDPWHSSQV